MKTADLEQETVSRRVQDCLAAAVSDYCYLLEDVKLNLHGTARHSTTKGDGLKQRMNTTKAIQPSSFLPAPRGRSIAAGGW